MQKIYFSIADFLFNILQVPGITGLVQWTHSGYFDNPLAMVSIEAISTTDPNRVTLLGKSQADAGKFLVDTSIFPWDYQGVQGSYILRIVLDNSTYGVGSKFMVARNKTSACDPYAIAASFSHEAYGVLFPDRTYESCGIDWTLEYLYNVADNAAFVVSSENLKLAVVSFRGTIGSVSDWINSLSITQKPCSSYLRNGCDGGFLHAGFSSVFNITAAEIRTLVGRYLPLGFDIILTGHSKGAAIATIQALDIIQEFPSFTNSIRLITFGSPRVGDPKFVSALNSVLSPADVGRNVRYVNANARCGDDPVTTVPPSPPYSHAGSPSSLICPVCLFRPAEDELQRGVAPKGVAVACHSIELYKTEIAIDGQGHLYT